MENRENEFDLSEKKVLAAEDPERESEKVIDIIGELRREGEGQVNEIREYGSAEDAAVMEGAAEEAENGAQAAEEDYIRESAEEEMRRMEIVKDFVNRNYHQLEETAENIGRRLGLAIDSEAVILKLAELMQNEEVLREMEEGGFISEEMSAAAVSFAPVIENAVRSLEEEGETRTAKEQAKKIIVEVLASTDAAKDPERIAAAGRLLILLAASGKITDARACLIIKTLGTALQYEIVQKKISGKFRQWLERNREEGRSDEQIAEEMMAEVGY